MLLVKEYPGESVTGYVLRLAQANGINRPREFLTAIRLSPLRGWSADIQYYINGEMSGLHALKGLSLMGLRGALPHSTERLDPRFLMGETVKYCPDCLREALYWRIDWEHALLPFCLRHMVTLTNKCSCCGVVIGAWRSHIGHCRCGSLLAKEPAKSIEPAHETAVLLAALIASKLNLLLPIECVGSADVFPAELRGLSAHELHRLVEFLGTYGLAGNRAKSRRSFVRADIDGVVRLLSVAAQVLAKWPTGFNSLLHRLLMADHEGKEGLRRCFGYFYVALYKEFADGGFDFLREGFEVFLINHWSGVFNGRNRRLSAWIKRDQSMIPAATVMRLHGVSRAMLRSWVVSGVLPGKVSSLPSGRELIVIEKASLGVISRLSDLVDLRTAAQMLGLPERRVLELLAADVLHGQSPDAGERWKIQRTDIERVLADLRAVAVTGLVSSQGLVRLDSVLRHYLKNETSFVVLFSALLSGAIPFEWNADSSGLDGLWLDKARLKSWLQPAGNLVGVPVLATLLGIKQEVAYHIIRKQLILAEVHGRKGRLIELNEVKRFQSEYVLARDLAQMLCTSPRHLIHRLTVAGVASITGPTVDGCRQVIYRRASLSHLPIPASIAKALDELGDAQVLLPERKIGHESNKQ